MLAQQAFERIQERLSLAAENIFYRFQPPAAVAYLGAVVCAIYAVTLPLYRYYQTDTFIFYDMSLYFITMSFVLLLLGKALRKGKQRDE